MIISTTADRVNDSGDPRLLAVQAICQRATSARIRRQIDADPVMDAPGLEAETWQETRLERWDETDSTTAKKPKSKRQSNPGKVDNRTFPVPAWCMWITQSRTPEAIVLAYIRYWSESRMNAHGPRTAITDGRNFWVIGSRKHISEATGLTPDQVQRAVAWLLEAKLILRWPSADEPKPAVFELMSHQRQPRQGEQCLRLDPEKVAELIERRIRPEVWPLLTSLGSNRQVYFEHACNMDEAIPREDCPNDWYGSQIYCIVTHTAEYLRSWTTISPLLISEHSNPTDIIILSRLWAWIRVAMKKGRSSITRTLEQIADETSVIAITGNPRNYRRVEDALVRLRKESLIESKVCKSGYNKSYLTISIPPKAMARITKIMDAGIVGRLKHEPKVLGLDRDGVEIYGRNACPQHPGEPDGRWRAVSDERWHWIGQRAANNETCPRLSDPTPAWTGHAAGFWRFQPSP